MSSSAERMRRYRAKLKLEDSLLRCFRAGMTDEAVMDEVRLVVQSAIAANLVAGRHADRGDADQVPLTLN